MSPFLARRLPLLLVSLLLFSTGCLPGLDWLPDSSGFVYSGGKGKKQLMLFDVKAKKSKALVAEAVGNTWPAVSPDGKKVAAAVRSQRGATAYVTVRVFGRDGKLLHRSRDIEWKKAKGKDKDEPQVVQVGWSPDGEKLLLADVLRTALYDLKTTKTTFVEGHLLTFGNRPIRPDGKGAVTYGQEKFNWVDWSGKVQPIKVKLPEEKKGKADPEGDALMMLFPILFDSQWEGKVARVHFGEGDLRLDTGKLTGEMRPGKKEGGPGTVRQSHTFAGGTVVRIVETKKDGGLEGPLALEVVRPRGKELIATGPKVMKLYPSPDGRLLAVRLSEDFEALFTDRKSDRIIVLDSAGKKVADFPVGE